MPTWNSGGTMAIRLGVPWLRKADSVAGRYFCKPLQVYRGIQSTGAVNWSGGALHEEAFPPENRQPMFGYYLGKV